MRNYVLAIHGGAGTVNRNTSPERQAAYHQGLRVALNAGEALLAAGQSAQAAVVKAVQMLEDDPLFNAGRGSVFTADGIQEMDACVMDGASLRAGAVAGVRTVRNPVLLAQAIQQDGRWVLLSGAGAENFARSLGWEACDEDYFYSEERWLQLQKVRASQSSLLDHDAANLFPAPPIIESSKMGTVGAVALDQHGNLAAATSTGGMTNKHPGRIGDSPVVGAGCYADNRSAAISCTGTGEHFLRCVLAHQVAARMRFGGSDLAYASNQAIFSDMAAIGGRGGLIAVDKDGNLAMPFNTSGMYRAWVKRGEEGQVAIWA